MDQRSRPIQLSRVEARSHFRHHSLPLRHFEFIYFCLVVGVTGFSVIWPILIMIGHGIILGMCCCKDDNGKNGGIVVVVMNSIGIVGFIIDLFVIGFVAAVCDIWQDEVDRGVEKQSDVPSSCSVVGAAAAFNWICLILRIVAIVLASKVSCCRSAPPSVTVITTAGAAPAAGIPIAAQATQV